MKAAWKVENDDDGQPTGAAWITVRELDGFEPYVLRLKVERRSGIPTAVAIHLDPVSRDSPPVTGPLLSRLPVTRLVRTLIKAVDFRLQPDLPDELRDLRKVSAENPNTGESPADVAAVWLEAHHAGRAPRAAVAKHFRIGIRTADNRIREATNLGLIPEEYRLHARRQKKNQ